jgi:hypothetical protein
MKDARYKKVFIFGFIALILCGVGDWLLGYEPQGGEAVLWGISRSTITEVPAWFYILSMFFGILSAFACQAYAPLMEDVVRKEGVSSESKLYKWFHFGLSSAPLMFISFHTACCVALIFLRGAMLSGMDVASVNSHMVLPMAASLLPFTIWCLLCDIPASIAFVGLVIRGDLKISKAAILCTPFSMSILGKIVGAILLACGSPLVFMAACGESWGWGFMCLAFYFITKKGSAVR